VLTSTPFTRTGHADKTPVNLPIGIPGTTLLVVKDPASARAALPDGMLLEAIEGDGPEAGSYYARLSVDGPAGVDADLIDSAVDAIRGANAYVMRAGFGAVTAASSSD
jgi:hypothetical protein